MDKSPSRNEANLRSQLLRPPPIDGPKGPRARARAIIALYGKALINERNAGDAVGDRKLKRKIVPPRDRASNILKREIYRCAVEMALANSVDVVRSFVVSRDGRRYSSSPFPEIDWSLRLIAHQKPLAVKFEDYRPIYHDVDQGMLLNPTSTSRVATELRFAWEFGIRWQLVDMFADHAGGYELISAYNQGWDRPFRSGDWFECLRDPDLMTRPAASTEDEWPED